MDTLTLSPAASRWLAEYRDTLSPRNVQLLARAAATLEANIVAADGVAPPWHPRRGICPSPSTYAGVWNWDAAFHAIAVARWDAALARDQIMIVLDAQLPSGGLVDVLYADGRVVDAFGKPPVLPWAAQIVDRISPDGAFARRVYDAFRAYEQFWRAQRGGDAEGLFHYDSAVAEPAQRAVDAKYESGWDTSVRWDGGSYTLWPIDLNCYMVLTYRALAHFATRLGHAQDARTWTMQGRLLAERIEQQLFDPTSGAYVDAERVSGAWSAVLTPASFMPLFIGSATPARAARLAGLAAAGHVFAPGMPTVAYNDPRYRSDDYWRGPMWLNVAYFALKGLQAYGYTALANAGRETILAWCHEQADVLYEYYDSRTGAGLGAPQFGWTAAFVIEFVLNWEPTPQ